MELNTPQRMSETVSLRLTHDERAALEHLAQREERTISNYVRRQLRSHLEQETGEHK
jgi:predicted DNA-binding protein